MEDILRRYSQKIIFVQYPLIIMKMKNLSFLLTIGAASAVTSCGKLGKSGKGFPDDGQLHGVAPASKYNLSKPPGMVYIPPGTFHMGPSDEDINYAYTARNKQVSINGFWMDATEITNNEYRQFVNWVRDSIAATLMQYGKEVDGKFQIDWKKTQTIKWSDKATTEKIDQLILTPENRIFGKKEIDPSKLIYHSETFNLKEAAKKANEGKMRSSSLIRKISRSIPIRWYGYVTSLILIMSR